MHFTALSLLLAVAMGLEEANAKPPSLLHLYQCNVTMGMSLKMGAGLRSATSLIRNTTRAMFPISGGQFEGSKMSGISVFTFHAMATTTPYVLISAVGKVLAVGAEWGEYDDFGWYKSEGRYQLKTLDGADISVHAIGNTVPDGKIHVYVNYETSNNNYTWMNEIAAVGILNTTKWGYTVDVYQLHS